MDGQGCFTPASLDHPVGDGRTPSLGELLGETTCSRAVGRGSRRPRPRRTTPQCARPPHPPAAVLRRVTQREIAEDIGVTQMQVSRLLTRICRDLRRSLGPLTSPPPAELDRSTACARHVGARTDMTSLWLDDARPIADDALPHDQHLDDLVVGAGLTGPGDRVAPRPRRARVAVVEARQVGAVDDRQHHREAVPAAGHAPLPHPGTPVAEGRGCVRRSQPRGHGVAAAVLRRPRGRRAAASGASPTPPPSPSAKTVEREHRAATDAGPRRPVGGRSTYPSRRTAPRCSTTRPSSTRCTCWPRWWTSSAPTAARSTRGIACAGSRCAASRPAGLDDGATLRADQLRARHRHADPRPRALLRQGRAAALLRAGLRRGRVRRRACTSPPGRTAARCATLPERRAPKLLVGGSGHVVGRTCVGARARRSAPRVDAELLPRAPSRRTDGRPRTTARTTASPSWERSPAAVAGSTWRPGFEKWGMTNAVAAARVLSGRILGEEAVLGPAAASPESPGRAVPPRSSGPTSGVGPGPRPAAWPVPPRAAARRRTLADPRRVAWSACARTSAAC